MDLGKAEGIAFPILFILSLFVFRGVVAALHAAVRRRDHGDGHLPRAADRQLLPALSQFALNIVIGLGLGLAIDYSLFIVSRYREELAQTPPEARTKASTTSALRRSMLPPGARSPTARSPSRSRSRACASSRCRSCTRWASAARCCALMAAGTSLVALPALLAVLGPQDQRAGARSAGSGPPSGTRGGSRTARGTGWRSFVTKHAVVVAIVSAAFLIASEFRRTASSSSASTRARCRTSLSSRKVDDALQARFPSNASSAITAVVKAPAGSGVLADRGAGETGCAGCPARCRPEAHRLAAPKRLLRVRRASEGAAARRADDRPRQDDPRRARSAGRSSPARRRRSSTRSRASRRRLWLMALILRRADRDCPVPHDRLGGAPDQDDDHERAVAERGVWDPGADLPGRPPRGAARLQEPPRDRPLPARADLRDRVGSRQRLRGPRPDPDQGGSRRGHHNTDSVAIGMERTGRIVTQAAILFCVAIGAFSTSAIIFIKEVGIGTAVAVIIDASIVRAFLVPSLMVLLGDWNWWAPAPLRQAAPAHRPERRHSEDREGRKTPHAGPVNVRDNR